MLETNLKAIESAHPDRLLFADLYGRTERVILLDWPFRIAEKYVGVAAYSLRRITIAELPGWKEAISFLEDGVRNAGLRDCRLLGAKLGKRVSTGLEGVELVLTAHGESFKCWHLGCPAALLKCEAATLNQDGAMGKKLMDLQNMRLVGAD